METIPERFNLADYYLDQRIAEGLGEKVAVYQAEGGQWTYEEVYRGSNRMANALVSLGVEQEDRVLIVLPDTIEFVYSWFGTLKCGAVFTMVNPRLKPQDYAYYLEYTRAKVMVTSKAVYDQISTELEGARHLQHVLVVGDDVADEQNFHRVLEGQGGDFTNADTHKDDLAGWLFTSGSTGHPKAAVHMHQDFAFNTERYAKEVLGIRPDDITLSVPKLYFGYATGTNLMFPFAVGASTILFNAGSKAPLLFDLIEKFRPTVLTSVPTMIGAMLAEEDADSRDLSSLRLCLSAGEALPAELYQRWVERTGVEILDGIGSAEMFHIYITNYPGDVKLGSLGKLVPGYQARIVDPEGAEVATGDVGTLHIKGASAALCYWQDREKSRKTFHGDWCLTSDQFRKDENGYFYYCGRADDLLKVGGIFVSPIEVENALLGHDSVKECAVLGYEDEGLIKPLAVIALQEGHEGGDALAEALQQHVKGQLAPYKYPRKVIFLSALPKNDRGKIDRKALKAEYGGDLS